METMHVMKSRVARHDISGQKFLIFISTIKEVKFNRMKSGFLHRRYAISLGRRYVIAAVGLILPDVSSVYGDSQDQSRYFWCG